MAENLTGKKAGFGTAPVFFAAISTILGAILFLRFGWAVGNLGLVQTIVIIILGHVVTIPTGMAIAEIATNQKVEGGGAYFMISRSFGLNIGAAIGVALYLAQAISVAFYVIAFAEAFKPVFMYLSNSFGWHLSTQAQYFAVSIPTMIILTIIFLTKGADIGVKVLYAVATVLFISILFFLVGKPVEGFDASSISFMHGTGKTDFFKVFIIIFPAFTGIAAGLGLSGDLKDPSRSLPRGTMWATFVGMIVYIAIAIKFAFSASVVDLADPDKDMMYKISVWGPIVPIGLACATISSALGSIMIAPRTLQALGGDNIFPLKATNQWFSKERKGEPINAAALTCAIAFVFIIVGGILGNGVDFVAKIISMFFMVTYGAICLISFLEHFAADPAYRPTFRSNWVISLLGTVACLYLMFRMNAVIAFIALILMTGIYLWITYNKNKNEEGLASIFQGVIFQLSRQMQVFLQKSSAQDDSEHWRPSVVCISSDSFERFSAFDLLRWISLKYGFGTYIHFITGYLSKETSQVAKEAKQRLIKMAESSKSNVYLDTMISPSYTSAIAQVIQLPGISGKDNNMLMFEYPKGNVEKLQDVIDNMQLMKSTDFDLCILGSSPKGFGYNQEIHIWITLTDYENANLMILLGYIILGHPDWKNGKIKLFAIYPQEKFEEEKKKLVNLVSTGRLPISIHNIKLIPRELEHEPKEIIGEHSKDADLTIVGFRSEIVKHKGTDVFEGFDGVGNVLFVNTNQEKEIS